jgi:hypothetical protein
MEDKISLKDLEFVSSVDPGLGELILDVCISNIHDLNNAIESLDNVDNKFITELPKEKLQEMFEFYEGLVDFLVQYEKYEECAILTKVLITFKKYL